jgi:hypothetical protein
MNYLEVISMPERRAVNIIKLMLDEYNSKDGEGLFKGVERYAVLEQRLKISASQSRTLREFWSRSLSSLMWSSPGGATNKELLGLLLEEGEREVLVFLRGQIQTLIAIARELHSSEKASRRETRAKTELDTTPVTEVEVKSAGGLFNE